MKAPESNTDYSEGGPGGAGWPGCQPGLVALFHQEATRDLAFVWCLDKMRTVKETGKTDNGKDWSGTGVGHVLVQVLAGVECWRL